MAGYTQRHVKTIRSGKFGGRVLTFERQGVWGERGGEARRRRRMDSKGESPKTTGDF